MNRQSGRLSDEVLHVAALVDRINWLEKIDRERGGGTPSRTAEYNALVWAVERLTALDPRVREALPAAFERADDRARGNLRARGAW